MTALHLTIVETGQAPAAIRDQFPDYPAMFRQMFDSANAGFSYQTVSVAKGETLPDPVTLSAVLYTGSPAGVYDPEPWIGPLKTFIQGAAAATVPQAGICFGHQIMAEALGGKVAKSDKGWGIGRHTYELVAPSSTPHRPDAPTLSIAVSHQDQVLVKPDAARVIAQSTFTPFAGLAYEGYPAISFQCHPEFAPDFAAALYIARRGISLSDADADAAVASLAGPCDRRLLAGWLAGFLHTNARL